ncbi:beta-class carbonic anhydrase [Streptomyces sp. NPDC002851]
MQAVVLVTTGSKVVPGPAGPVSRRTPGGRAMSAIDDVLEKNAAFAAAYEDLDPPRLPRKRLAVIACMDSRLDIYQMLGLEEGDAHVIRNAGGVVTEDTIRSLVISQRIGGTREIMLMHNTECGMLTFKDDELKRQVESETGTEVPFEFQAFSDLEEQVRRSVARIRESLLLVHKDAIRGFVYEVRTGRLREVR